jgi:integral membrane protein (TIGR01906 family)
MEKRKNLINTILLLTFTSALCLLCLLWSIKSVALDLRFYEKLWAKYDVEDMTGMTQGDLHLAGNLLIDYFQGKVLSPNMTATIFGDERPLYNESELQHLTDVQKLFQQGLGLLKRVGFLAGTSLLITVTLKKDNIKSFIGNGLIFASILTFSLMLVLIVPARLNFGDWWTKFHLVTFTNDLWRLDPSQDWLIRLFPEEFFYAAVKTIGCRALLLAGMSLVLGLTVRYFSTYNSH